MLRKEIERIIELYEDSPDRPGLKETPARVEKYWNEIFSGYTYNASMIESMLKMFDDGAEGYNGIVFEKDIPFFSMCEHHMAPFFGHAHIAVLPHRRIVGLSKLARLVDVYARRLQVQERLTKQIADTLFKVLEPRGVAVVVEARHLCMESRGVRAVGVTTKTSTLLGDFLEEGPARAEFFSLINK